jgi:hypothetical protein
MPSLRSSAISPSGLDRIERLRRGRNQARRCRAHNAGLQQDMPGVSRTIRYRPRLFNSEAFGTALAQVWRTPARRAPIPEQIDVH